MVLRVDAAVTKGFPNAVGVEVTPAGPGSGLGLAIVFDMLQRIGGEVSASASPHLGGARFLMRTPKERCWETTPAPAVDSQRQLVV